VDVEPRSLTLDPKDLERRLGPKTRAVIPVHIFGQAADMAGILKVCGAKRLKVVEDCAQAHMALYRGAGVGGLGDFGAFSFYPSKNLGALGDAGALSANDAKAFEDILLLRDVGRKPGEPRYIHARVGHNARLDELQAAFLRVKLKRLPQWTAQRRRIAEIYREGLGGLDLVLPPEHEGGTAHAYHLFTVQTPRRDALAEHLKRLGIGTAVYYSVPLHLQPAYKSLGHKEGDFPQTERASREVLSLPMYPELPEAQARRVAEEIRRFFKK
jgi:dTDP-4-amino-4,6-dideoxygalactose transaminase